MKVYILVGIVNVIGRDVVLVGDSEPYVKSHLHTADNGVEKCPGTHLSPKRERFCFHDDHEIEVHEVME